MWNCGSMPDKKERNHFIQMRQWENKEDRKNLEKPDKENIQTAIDAVA